MSATSYADDRMDREAFARRLLPGERIVWAGHPGRGLVLSPRDIFLIPFSLLWCGFTIFWTSMATWNDAPFFFRLWGLMFVSIGLYLVFGRFVVDSWVRRATRYAVTDRRVLIARSRPFGKFTAIALDQLADIHLKERGNGSGTIRFGEETSIWMGRGGRGGWTPALDPTPQFIAIKNVSQVFDLVQPRS